MSKGLSGLLNEINCRIEHGSNDNGHLNYVRYEIEKILYGENVRERDLDKEIKERSHPEFNEVGCEPTDVF